MRKFPRWEGTYCRLLLALFALALIGATSTPARAQTCGGGYSTAFVTTPPYFDGSTETVTITMTASVTGGASINNESVTQLDYIMGCANMNGSFASCNGEPVTGNPIGYAGSISTNCVDATSNPVTWVETASASPPGHIIFTPSSVANEPFLASNGASCSITFSMDVNASAAAGNVTQDGAWGGTCNVDPGGVLETIGGGGSGSDTVAVTSCSVALDKQISCDDGVTWADATTFGVPDGASVTGACTGFSGDPIQVRFVAKNTGTTILNSCNIHDVTGPTASATGGTEYTQDTTISSIAAGATDTTPVITVGSDGATALTCNAAGPNLDSAEITCTCGTSSVTVNNNDTAAFSCESCGVQIDKQVSCAGGAFVDVFGTDDTVDSAGTGDNTVDTCLGLDAITNPPRAADTIAVQYVISNTGTDGVNTCTYGETNAAITGVITIPGAPVTIDANTTLPALPFSHPCSPALVASEVSGMDSATIGCTCNSLTNNSIVRGVGFKDTAGFTCEAPGLNVMKTCAPGAVGGSNAVTVTATNTSATATTTLTGCVATDTYATGTNCPATLPFPNIAALTPTTPVDLGVAGSGTASFTWNGDVTGLTANACNDGSVTCYVDGNTSLPITANFEATCPVGAGCESRTPGFWKTHPNLTQEVINYAGGQLESCGLELNNVNAGEDCSAIEDMCSIGSDAAKLGINPVQANLIFQCAAAELNLAVTVMDGGNCTNSIPNSNLMFSDCCGSAGACATNTTVNGADIASCQAAVGAFNALYDNTTLGTSSILNTPGAHPGNCQAANGNRFVNDAKGGPDCSDPTGRIYVQKVTGKKK